MVNSWDERYGTDEYVYGQQPNDFLFEASRFLINNSRVLSLGEGEGRNAVFLAQKGHQVLALDASIVGLEKAKKLANEKSVLIKTQVADLNDYQPGEEKFDAIISIWCHLPQDLRKKLYGQLSSWLKPGGVFLLEAYNPEQLKYKTGGPPNIEMLVSKADLLNELKDFDILLLQETTRDVQEGKLHHGMSAVVQCVAKKR